MFDNEKVGNSDVMHSIKAFREAFDIIGDQKYVLHLYVAGMGPKSIQAVNNIKRICEEHMPGKYKMKVIDIYQNPVFANDGQIIAAPTLVKELPPPLRKLIGSMSDTERVLLGIDLKSKTDEE